MEPLDIPVATWAFLMFIPITVLCVFCKKKKPTRIQQTFECVYKDNFTKPPSSSFIVISGSHYPQRTLTSPSIVSQRDLFLDIPRTPALGPRRVSYIEANEPGISLEFGNRSEQRSHSVSHSRKDKSSDEEYEEENGGNYTNEKSARDYIEVIPEKNDQVPTINVLISQDNRASMSSVNTDENYVNVENSCEAKDSCSCNDDNYVNVGTSDLEDTQQSESSEYVNVEDDPKNSGNDSDDENDYENVKSQKGSRSGRHSSC
ncbi:hypothetical protein XENTR_v90028043mg [Pelobates cultripes]|uniref:Uncharacterized protein n=1 Tax=Pelobates cultripes TaxID=61616 RepID=A0AAD1SSB5_PELCU|nr:hypothetical protein XENTR_v90028043mg [Pelobates cultripes]